MSAAAIDSRLQAGRPLCLDAADGARDREADADPAGDLQRELGVSGHVELGGRVKRERLLQAVRGRTRRASFTLRS